MTIRKNQIFIDPRALFYLQISSKQRLELREYVQSPLKSLYQDSLQWVYTQRKIQEYDVKDFHDFVTRARGRVVFLRGLALKEDFSHTPHSDT